MCRNATGSGSCWDVSHLNEKGFWDLAGITDRPIVASHSNAHSICESSRNLTDKQLAAIRESKGLVGVNFHVAFLRPDGKHQKDTPLEVVADHVAYLVDHLGEDHVGLGSDFDGCLPPQGLSDVTGLPALFDVLRQRGFDQATLEKIAYRNWISMLEKIGGVGKGGIAQTCNAFHNLVVTDASHVGCCAFFISIFTAREIVS